MIFSKGHTKYETTEPFVYGDKVIRFEEEISNNFNFKPARMELVWKANKAFLEEKTAINSTTGNMLVKLANA